MNLPLFFRPPYSRSIKHTHSNLSSTHHSNLSLMHHSNHLQHLEINRKPPCSLRSLWGLIKQNRLLYYTGTPRHTVSIAQHTSTYAPCNKTLCSREHILVLYYAGAAWHYIELASVPEQQYNSSSYKLYDIQKCQPNNGSVYQF